MPDYVDIEKLPRDVLSVLSAIAKAIQEKDDNKRAEIVESIKRNYANAA